MDVSMPVAAMWSIILVVLFFAIVTGCNGPRGKGRFCRHCGKEFVEHTQVSYYSAEDGKPVMDTFYCCPDDNCIAHDGYGA